MFSDSELATARRCLPAAGFVRVSDEESDVQGFWDSADPLESTEVRSPCKEDCDDSTAASSVAEASSDDEGADEAAAEPPRPTPATLPYTPKRRPRLVRALHNGTLAATPPSALRPGPLSFNGDDSDEFTEFQAILAGIPQHAVPPRGSRPGACAEPRCVERVAAALQRAALDYPKHARAIGALEVVHASLDLVCLVDRRGRRLFATARGTDRCLRGATLPRDLGNDALIALGFGPVRARCAAAAYSRVCKQLPGYQAFGTGHSLGGTVIEWLAHWAEAGGHDRRRFLRIDLFNPGSSPLRRRAVPLAATQVCAHCVCGDFVSKFHKASGTKNVLQPQKKLARHALGHFLPAADEAAAVARETVALAVARSVAAICTARFALELCGARAVGVATKALANVAWAQVTAEADALNMQVVRAPRRSRLSLRSVRSSAPFMVQPKQQAGTDSAAAPRRSGLFGRRVDRASAPAAVGAGGPVPRRSFFGRLPRDAAPPEMSGAPSGDVGDVPDGSESLSEEASEASSAAAAGARLGSQPCSRPQPAVLQLPEASVTAKASPSIAGSLKRASRFWRRGGCHTEAVGPLQISDQQKDVTATVAVI